MDHMYKIKKILFNNHPILGKLELDFCDGNGKAVDTVIFAGENGTGKSTILNTLFSITMSSQAYDFSLYLEMPDGSESRLFFSHNDNGDESITNEVGKSLYRSMEPYKSTYAFRAIFSDVDIVFSAGEIGTVSSLDIDSVKKSKRSTAKLPTEIKQLIVDLQAQDDSQLAQKYRAAKEAGLPTDGLEIEGKIDRFTRAFQFMFDSLSYYKVENKNGHKDILFRKNGKSVRLDDLSSGEKQIVYRGSFLLQDIHALNGAFVFIDEPEISLHPNWQMKIMDYYKRIFTDKNGNQTSQIFAVTHSPFVIHNENRRNDKVIVLDRDKSGNIAVKDKPEYFKCTSTELIKDAFYIRGFSDERPTVYLEGRTDEKYFNRAVEVYNLPVPFQFKWIGYLDDRGQEVNTGEKSIDAAFQFLVSRNLPIKNICLKDCDTNRNIIKKNNVIIFSMPFYENSKGIKKGIENALNFDKVDLAPYYSSKSTKGDYGEEKKIETFNKMACCDAICAMDTENLKEIFINLKTTLERLIELYNED